MKVKELAEAMGYSPELVSAVERLLSRPSPSFQARASAVLGVDESALFPEWRDLIERAEGQRFDRRVAGP
jgi:transcriptional regulator with XRE-family HTH domain